MSEPFKNAFNETVIQDMAKHFVRVQSDFDKDGFIAYATHDLESLELKERSSHITDALERFLPGDFQTAANLMVTSLKTNSQPGIKGWPIMPMTDYIARHGQDDVVFSLDVLKAMTPLFSSEFAIRPFLHNHCEMTLKIIAPWVTDTDEHVRRLVSEGTRPRLPWGMRLARFVEDPTPVIQLLKELKDDPSEYVRRSVANNLNDIAKDHADQVATLAHSWMQESTPERQRLIRHSLRTLIKSGHPGSLSALGYGPPKIALNNFVVQTPTVQVGNVVEFECELTSTIKKGQPLIIDYAVHHVRQGGKMTAKVFKWKMLTLKGNTTLTASRKHSFKKITTRRYYPGRHRIEILVNGKSLGYADFTLTL